MKALIRNEGETITEDMSIEWIDWNTGMPLTGPNWAGGPYTLVQNYIPPEPDPEEGESSTTAEATAEANAAKAAQIEELKTLLYQLESS